MGNLSERILGSQRLSEIEQILGEALTEIELIGELAINEAAFQHLARMMRSQGTFENRKARLTEAVSYMVSMVFSARYDKDEKRNFWKPYLKDVWQRDNNQNNYNTARENFDTARSYLEKHYGLYFPRKLAGDVVRSVYYHTIIPAYLYDDFARWISPIFDKLLSLSQKALEEFIQSESATLYIARRLRAFLQEENGIALSLIQELLATYALYMESGDEQILYECLPSPIYHSLWAQILPELSNQTQAGLQRIRRSRLEWVWSFDEEEWVLRFVNLITNAQQEPRLIIWSNANPEQAFWNNYRQHELWPERIEGKWRIPERVLGSLDSEKPEMLDARIYIYDRSDKLIMEYPVPALPTDDYLIYRISQQGQYAIPLPQPYKLLDGNYLISYRGDFRLETEGKPIEPQREFSVQTGNGWHRAGLYPIQLPLTIHANGQSESFYASESRQMSAEIRGDGKIEGLALDVPPVFTGGNLRLVLEHLPQKHQHLQLVIRGKESIKHAYLKNHLLQTEEGSVFDLADFIDSEHIGTYELDITYNLQSRLAAPLQFSVVPKLKLEAPNRALYNPLNLPEVRFWHSAGEILEGRGARKEVRGAETVITWQDLREDLLQVQIRDGDSYVPLAWRIQRVAAWFEQTSNSNLLLPNEVQRARLEIRGEARQRIVLRVGQNPYEITLDAKGRYSNPVSNDRLKDMLAENPNDDVLLQIESYGEAWPLATYVRRPRVLSVDIEYYHDLGLSCKMQLSHQGLGKNYLLQILNSNGRVVCEETVVNFEQSIDMECRLSPDRYSLQLLQDGKALTMPENCHFEVDLPKLAFFVLDYKDERLELAYQIEQDATGEYLLEIWKAEQLLCREKISNTGQHQIDCQLEDGLYRFDVLWNQRLIYREEKPIDQQFARAEKSNTVQVGLNHNEQIYYWASLSASDLLRAYDEQTYREWRTLRRLAEVHQPDTWLHKYGMIPSWAVLDKSLRFTVLDKSYPIFPEKVLERGMTGIGKIAVNFGNVQYGYARWTRANHRYVRLQVYIPEKDPGKATYASLDELDMWPAYYDVKSGSIHASRSRSLRPGKQADGSFLVDMVHDYLCLGFLDSNNRDLLHSLRPEQNLDRYLVKETLEDGELPAVANDEVDFKNILSADAYRFAVTKWFSHFDYRGGNSRIRAAIQALTNREQSATFQDFADSLYHMAERENIPYLKGVQRFLAAMEAQVDSQSHRYMLLDRHVFLLAVVLRSRNLPATLFRQQIRESLRLSDAELIEISGLANFACPWLLEWALTWAEILFVHSAA